MLVVRELEWPCYRVKNNECSSLYSIAYGSKTLTAAETRYANIERELLGVVGVLEKFHTSHLDGQWSY